MVRTASPPHMPDVSGALATPGAETKRIMAATEGTLRQLDSVVGSLAWASPIRFSGRGMEPPADRRRSCSTYQRNRTGQAVSVLKHARALAADPGMGVRRDVCYSCLRGRCHAVWHGGRGLSIRGLCITSLSGEINAKGYFVMIGIGRSIWKFSQALKTSSRFAYRLTC